MVHLEWKESGFLNLRPESGEPRFCLGSRERRWCVFFKPQVLRGSSKSGPVAEIARETAVLRWCTELKELQRLPPPLELRCFTHGDTTLENFLVQDGRLSGIVDLGRAGIAHPAQDWALALRSMRDEFGIEGEQIFRQQLRVDCADEALLRRFCLLDELF